MYIKYIEPKYFDGVRNVVGYSYNKDRYLNVIFCPICAKDPEMYGEGLFFVDGQYKRKQLVPCGCSKNHKYTESQFIILVKRELSKTQHKGLSFVKLSEEFNGYDTRFEIMCATHGVFTTLLDNIRYKKSNNSACTKCSGTYVKTPEEYTEHCNSQYVDQNFKFFLPEDLPELDHSKYVYYSCPKCSNDEYVKEGICSGVFRLHKTQINKKAISCRCSSGFYWKEPHVKYQITKIIKEENLKDKFIGFVDGYKNNTSKFIRECQDHGEYTTTVVNFKNRRDGCPLCYKSRFNSSKPAYVYLVRWYGFGEEYLKFGITNREVIARVKEQYSKCDLDYEILSSYYFENGILAEKLENIIKDNFETSLCSKTFMRNGHTETTSVDNYELISFLCEEFSTKYNKVYGEYL